MKMWGQPPSAVRAARSMSLAPNPEPKSRAKINRQRGIAHDFVIPPVQRVHHTHIRSNVPVNGIPSAKIGPHIARRMIDVERVEIRIRPRTHEASTQIRTPPRPEIRKQQSRRMLRTPQQRLPRIVKIIHRRRIVENLRGRIGVSRVQQKPRPQLRLQLHLCAVRERFIHVLVLTNKVHQVNLDVVDLVVKQVVEVSRIENILAAEEILLKPRLESADTFRLQRSVGKTVRWPRESLLQPRIFKSGSVRKSQPCAGKNFSTTQKLISQRNPRHAGVSIRAVMNKPHAADYDQPPQRELLLPVNVILQSLPVSLAKVDVAYITIFVFHAIPKRRVRPGPLRIIALIYKSAAVNAVHFMRLKIDWVAT